MTIKMEFDNYKEMYDFCASIVMPAAPAGRKEEAPSPEASAIRKENEPSPEVPDAREEEEAPFQEEKVYLKTDVRAYLAKLQKEGKKKEVTELINSLGFSKFSEVPEDRYPELMKKAGDL